MNAKKKPHGMKSVRKKKEKRTALAARVAILIAIISISAFIINSLLNQPSESQTVISTSERKAAIVDQLSLTHPNQTFIETATNTLKQAGYRSDYYPGEKVTVELYQDLPAHNYGIIILRIHSSAAALEGKEFVDAPVVLFTSENYSRTSHVWEQLTDQLAIASYSMPQPPYCFAITPKFVTESVNGNFRNSIVVMMGCGGLNNTKMADAFIEKGAKAYVGWKGSVLASHTDQAMTHLLQHLVLEKQTVRQAVDATMKEAGPDPMYNSQLAYYPVGAENFTIQNIVGNLVTSNAEIKRKEFSRTGYHEIS